MRAGSVVGQYPGEMKFIPTPGQSFLSHLTEKRNPDSDIVKLPGESCKIEAKHRPGLYKIQNERC